MKNSVFTKIFIKEKSKNTRNLDIFISISIHRDNPLTYLTGSVTHSRGYLRRRWNSMGTSRAIHGEQQALHTPGYAATWATLLSTCCPCVGLLWNRKLNAAEHLDEHTTESKSHINMESTGESSTEGTEWGREWSYIKALNQSEETNKQKNSTFSRTLSFSLF